MNLAMFTGLVQARGRLKKSERVQTSLRIECECDFSDLSLGESIAVDGVCLTVAGVTHGGFVADVSRETLAKTTIGRLRPGAVLNLERSLRASDRLGGHWVSGHVDAFAEVLEVTELSQAKRVSIQLPTALAVYAAAKGSIAVNGVSLTVNAVEPGHFEIMLIPHTCAVTNLGLLVRGSLVNLEVDMLARYVVRSLTALGVSPAELQAIPSTQAKNLDSLSPDSEFQAAGDDTAILKDRDD